MLASPLMDALEFATAMETAFREIWEDCQNKLHRPLFEPVGSMSA
jgi:hypothetical protein